MTRAMHPTRILVATGNAGKVREIGAILAGLPVTLLRIDDLTGPEHADLGPPPSVLEDGATFALNAASKARLFALWSHLPTIGEDSGLDVDALYGAPGVYSARYAGPEATDDANNAKLVAELAGLPAARRAARFRCAVALAGGNGAILASTEGHVEGRIIDKPRGCNGFGYDPLFFVPEYGCTTAEMPADRKNAISHRGAAFRALIADLQRLLSQGQLSPTA